MRRYLIATLFVSFMCFVNYSALAQVPPPQMSYYDLSFKDAFWTNENTGNPCNFTGSSQGQGSGSYTNTPTHIFGYSLSNIRGKITVTLTWKSRQSNQPSTEPTLPYLIIYEHCKVKIKASSQGGTLDYADCGLPRPTTLSGTEDDGKTNWQSSEAYAYRLIDNPGASTSYSLTPKGKSHAPAVTNPPGPTIANGCTVECEYSANAMYGILPVSGTNCKYSFPIANVNVGDSVKVSCNGNEIYSATRQTGVALKTGCNYDSTHFPSNTLLTMKTEINGQTAKEDLFLVYNKFWIGNLGQLVSMSPDIPKALKDMNHDPINDSGDYEFSKPKLLMGSRYATVLYINVHGDPTHFSDSTDFANSPNTTTTGEISTIVQQRKIPPINLVYAYSCATCSGGSTAWADAFGIDGNSVDRAYVGFDQEAKFKNGNLAASVFWRTLKAGQKVTHDTTVRAAVQDAQAEYEGTGNNGAKLVIIGDSETTIFKFIYKHQGLANWFILN